MAHPTGLYFPYIHVRNDTWLKYAALYWPRLARFCPPGYPLLDSEVARKLRDELDFIRDLEPGKAVTEAARPFQELIETHGSALRRRFGIDGAESWAIDVAWSGSQAAADGVSNRYRWDRRTPRLDGFGRETEFAFIHHSQVSSTLAWQLTDAGLARTGRGHEHQWLGMHPDLASVYMCALTEQTAKRNHLYPVTDQVLPHVALSNWDVDRLTEVLVDQPLTPIASVLARDDDLSAYVSMAVDTVVPDDLAGVSVDKIIGLRKRYQAELDGFRQYVTEQVERLADLRDVEDPQTHLDYVRDEVERGVQRRLEELRAQVRGAGLEPVRALGHLKLTLPSGVAAAVAGALHVAPAVIAASAASGVVATSLVRLPSQARRKRAEAVTASPVGYLFHVGRELNPSGLIDRVHRAVGKAPFGVHI